MTKVKFSYILLTLIISILVVNNILAQDDLETKDVLADQIVQIRGNIKTFNEDKKDFIPVSSQIIIFQRLDCKKCLVATSSKLNGEYEILVNKGKYKFFVYSFDENQRLYNVVSPSQERIVDAQDKIRGTLFNIEVVYKYRLNLPPIVLEPK